MPFITPAYAQTPGGADAFMQFAPFILILVIMYFLIIRPQQRRAREHRELIANVRRGDTVVTSGGFIAKVTKVIDDNEVEVEIAPDTRARLVRSMIADVRGKGEPVKE
ncbi:MAG: preprotein translocase subunit YajC [Beijerinckiaceae bacterium]